MNKNRNTAQKVDNAIKKFCKNSSLELKERWKAWPIDLSKNEMHEVIGSLLARQVTLATEMVANPPIWNDHIAPVILRCMVDNHINLAWILKDPLERSRRFIYYGLGQVKLQIEHRKAMWKDQSEPGDKTFVENLEAWVNAQQFTFLTEVNVGSWAEMSTREMAEQAGILDFYNHCYIPFSATAHSMWHHVSRFNLTYCSQSLHRFHKVPITPKRPIDPFYATLAAKYMAKSFQAFDKTFNINVTVSNSYEYLLGQFDRIFRQTSKEEEKKSMS